MHGLLLLQRHQALPPSFQIPEPLSFRFMPIQKHALVESSPVPSSQKQVSSKALTKPISQHAQAKIKRVVQAQTEPQEVTSGNSSVALPVVSSEVRGNYEQMLVTWLNKYKQYPLRARRLGIEGDVLVLVEINRQGEVLRYELRTKASSPLLNDATNAMISRANPFPPMPENYPGETLEFVVPVRFVLK